MIILDEFIRSTGARMRNAQSRHGTSAPCSVRSWCAATSPNTVADHGSPRGSAAPTEAREPPSASCHVLDAACTKHSPHARSLDIRALEGFALCKLALPGRSHSIAFTPRVVAPAGARPPSSPAAPQARSRHLVPFSASAGLSRAMRSIVLDARPSKPGVERRCRAVDARADTAHVAWARPALRIALGRCVPLRCNAAALGRGRASQSKFSLDAEIRTGTAQFAAGAAPCARCGWPPRAAVTGHILQSLTEISNETT